MWSFAFVAVWAIAVSGNASLSDSLSDPFWQAREGMDVLAGGGWVHADHWASGAVSQFVPTSPGWELMLGLAYRAGGASLLYAVSVVAMAAAIAALWAAARRLGADVVLAPVMVVWLALSPGVLTLRATFAAAVLVVLLWTGLDVALARQGNHVPAWMVAIAAGSSSALGIWIHASWAVYGPVAALGACALWRSYSPAVWPRRLLGIALIITVGTAGTLLGPAGTGVWREAARVAAACRGLITEWMPPWSNPDAGLWTSLWLLAMLLVGAMVRFAWRQRGAVGVLEWLLLGLGAVLTVLTMTAIRFIGQGAIVLAPVLVVHLTRVLRSSRARQLRTRLGERGTGKYWMRVLAGVGAALLFATSIAGGQPFPRLRDPALQGLPSSCTLFSDAATANLVLLQRPDVVPWIDGRADMWGRERLTAAQRYLVSPRARELVPSSVTCVLLPNARYQRLVALLQTSSDWTIRAQSGRFTVWVKSVD